MTAIPTVSLKPTEVGNVTTSEAPVATVLVGQPTPLGASKQLGLSDLGEREVGHAEAWSGYRLIPCPPWRS
jgi:hypothetical protein